MNDLFNNQESKKAKKMVKNESTMAIPRNL